MRVFVWVDAWQQQCCGEDFGVGTAVSWSAVPGDGPDAWVEQLLGPEWAARVTHHEEHHLDEELHTEKVVGTVVSVREVRCRRVPQTEGTTQVLVPEVGSGRLDEVRRADPWVHEGPAEGGQVVTFDGWIVEVDDRRLG